MNNIRHVLLISVTLLLSACASHSQKATNEATPIFGPAYSEKAQTVPVDQFKSANCPVDNKWEGLGWKAIVPLANGCVKTRDWTKVEKMGNLLARQASSTPWGPFYLSVAAEGRHDLPRAEWMLELALKKSPSEGLFHYGLGRIHWELKEESEAIKHLKIASELSPSLTDAHFVMGQILSQRQDLAQAEHYWQKALMSNDKHLPSLLAMASLKMNAKDYAHAEEYLNRVITLSPHSSKARLALAQVQEEHLKKLPEALQAYKQLKQLAAEKKLDESVRLNLDEKIKALEKSISQVDRPPQVTARTPSGER